VGHAVAGHAIYKNITKSIFADEMHSTICIEWVDNLLPHYRNYVQRYVCTKLEVSTAFLFREYRRHKMDGQTDGMQHLM